MGGGARALPSVVLSVYSPPSSSNFLNFPSFNYFLPPVSLYSCIPVFLSGAYSGGGVMGAKPPWTCVIYLCKGVFRPRWVLKQNVSPPYKFLNTPLIPVFSTCINIRVKYREGHVQQIDQRQGAREVGGVSSRGGRGVMEFTVVKNQQVIV